MPLYQTRTELERSRGRVPVQVWLRKEIKGEAKRISQNRRGKLNGFIEDAIEEKLERIKIKRAPQ